MSEIDKRIIAVAVAQDKEVILTAAEAYQAGIADFILVGDQEKIKEIAEDIDRSFEFNVIDEKDENEASLLAAELVRKGEADVLMKGLVNSSVFLKAVLNEERGLRSGKSLSHLAAFEIPGQPKLAFYTDGGMNTFPDYEMKKNIVTNALEALKKLGIEVPKVAVLTANETVNPKMPSTVDAAKLTEAGEAGELPPCMIEGPVALDIALSREAAAHKKIESKISGDVDLFIVPNIEAGNMIGKTLIYCANAKMAGVILGGRKPIVMTSRAENAEGKMNSIILACLLS
ncbi:MAG: phosphate acyltransferase [Bacillota bacterium]